MKETINSKKEKKKNKQKMSREERERIEREKKEARHREVCKMIGVADMDEFYEVLYEIGEDIATRDLGFETGRGAYDNFIGCAEPSKAKIVKYKDRYILYVESEMTEGTWDILLEETRVFDTENEAIRAMNDLRYGYRPLKEIIREIKEELNDSKIWIDVKYDFYHGYYFNLKYDWDLVLEKYFELDAKTVREAIEHFHEFETKCKKRGFELTEVFKMPREWNDNQRYYCFKFCTTDAIVEKKIHIPSAMQHLSRVVCDFCTDKILKEVEEELKKLEEEYRPIKEYEQKRRKEKDEYAEKNEIHDLSDSELKDLAEYIAMRLNEDPCDGTLRYSREWLNMHFNDPDRELEGEIFLEKHDGYCGCEVIYNVILPNMP